jgi:glycosyltransferase involved in cell wall biosynthesis
MLWNLPLFLVAIFYFIVKRPKVVTYNGLASGLVLSPLFKLFGSKNVIMYHSYLSKVSDSLFTKLAKFCGSFVDVVVANSRGSAKDVSQIFDPNKVIVNEHFAEEVFFEKTGATKNNNKTFVISYAGRIDEDKLCFPLMDAAKQLFESGDLSFSFNFVGAGSAVGRIIDYASKYKNIHYLGYLNDRKKLKEYYENADVVWSLANETYLCIPAVEALATGKPIIIPIYSEVKNSDGKRPLVERTLLKDDIGWFVNTDNIGEIISLFKKIRAAVTSPSYNSENCTLYARERYSSTNLTPAIDRMKRLFD